MSREALRHSGAELSPESAGPYSAETSHVASPVEVSQPSSTLPPFKLDRAPVNEGEPNGDSKDPWSSGGTSRHDASGGTSTADFGFPRPTRDSSAPPTFAGRALGPDPYARREDGSETTAPNERPLAADLAPEATLDDRSEELSLSGLLGGRGRNGRDPAPAASADDDDPDRDQEPER